MTTQELPRLKWTIEEYHQLIEHGLLADKQVELLRGEIVEMSPENPPHYNQNDDGCQYLIQLLGDRAAVRQTGGSITLPNGSEPVPDIAICQPLGREYREHHPYPENIFWLVEYSDSTLKKDLEVKSGVYAEAEIQEYWIVNVQKNELIVMREPKDEAYQTQFTLNAGVISPLAFPNLDVDVLRVISP